MTAELRRSLVLAGSGLLAGFALVLALFGAAEMAKRWSGPVDAPATIADLPSSPAIPGGSITPETSRAEEAGSAQPGKSRPQGEQIPAPSPQASLLAEAKGPTFDIIRVEPNGESVIAGRGAPNTTVELLRDNAPIARALIDPSGQFALVPPALPPGNSEITLRITGSDGQVMLSKESVAVVISPNRETKPLIALSAPDRPTVVLSQPELGPSPTVKDVAKAGGSPDAKAKEAGSSSTANASSKDKPKDKGKAAQPPVKVVSVDAEEGGRLYVTGQATPGATVRLYLNDTLVAPGSAGPDGRLAFAIGRGVAPGDYRVRIDEIDSVSGKVKARSEVAFAVPAPRPTGPVAAGRETLAAQLKPPAGKGPEYKPSDTGASGSKVLRPEASGSPSPRQAATAPVDDQRPSPATPMAAPAGTGNTGKPEIADRTIFIPEIGTAKIARGDNLWQISRRAYGKGTRYTVIFDANQGQIRNPDLIYPGQIFVLPGGGTAERQDGKRG